jgi:hypothetical protein
VQRLRKKAQDAGNLKSNEQQKVSAKPASPPAASTATTSTTTTVTAPPAQVIVIEAADPQVVYVPSYNPTVVYGTWPYPAYPPYYYPPPPAYYPGYALASGIAFGIGVAAVGSLWGDCNWGHGDVDIDVNRYNNINSNRQISNNQNKFQHNGANRRGVPYRDSASQQKFGKSVPGANNRADFRGRDPARDAQRQRAQSSLSDRGMDPARGRDKLRNNPRERERAQNAARDGGFDRNPGRDMNGDRGGLDRGNNLDRTPGADRQRSSGLDREAGGANRGNANRDQASQRARGNSDNAFRNAGDARGTRQQFDRGSSSRQSMGGGGRRGGGRR